MKVVNINDIKISESFLKTSPSEYKMNKYRQKWLKTGRQQKYIVLGKEGYLVDGYIQYLILKQFGEEEVKCIYSHEKLKEKDINLDPTYRTIKTTYIWGIHPNSNDKKMYVWRIPNSNGWDSFRKNIKVGDMVFCFAKNKIAPVIVKTIQETETCPTPLDVKKVARKTIKRNFE